MKTKPPAISQHEQEFLDIAAINVMARRVHAMLDSEMTASALPAHATFSYAVADALLAERRRLGAK